MGGLRRLETGTIRTHFYPEGGWVSIRFLFLSVSLLAIKLARIRKHVLLNSEFYNMPFDLGNKFLIIFFFRSRVGSYVPARFLLTLRLQGLNYLPEPFTSFSPISSKTLLLIVRRIYVTIFFTQLLFSAFLHFCGVMILVAIKIQLWWRPDCNYYLLGCPIIKVNTRA